MGFNSGFKGLMNVERYLYPSQVLLLKLITCGQHETQQIREKPLLCVQAYKDHYTWAWLRCNWTS